MYNLNQNVRESGKFDANFSSNVSCLKDKQVEYSYRRDEHLNTYNTKIFLYKLLRGSNRMNVATRHKVKIE